jgi:hypothetical protein
MSADLHDQRIGVMAPTQAFFGYVQPATSVSATKVSPRLPATPIGVLDCTPWVRQQNNGQWVDH